MGYKRDTKEHRMGHLEAWSRILEGRVVGVILARETKGAESGHCQYTRVIVLMEGSQKPAVKSYTH